jgi:hypothetical protein
VAVAFYDHSSDFCPSANILITALSPFQEDSARSARTSPAVLLNTDFNVSQSVYAAA